MAKRKFVQIRNWDKFQHYKDRKPLWIKLYIDLLTDWDFGQLTETEQAQLMKLWLFAAKYDNKIPGDQTYLRRLLHSPRLQLKRFVDLGFVEPWSDTPRLREQHSRYISQELRAEILERDGFACVICSATEHLEIDHLIPISKGGTGLPSNLQVLCRSCNRRKRVRVGADAEQVATQISARAQRQRSPETETEEEKEIPTAVVEGANGEPVDLKVVKENGFHAERLIEAIGSDADDRTAGQVRSFIGRLPDAVFERIREQLVEGLAGHKGKYAHAELRREVAARSAA